MIIKLYRVNLSGERLPPAPLQRLLTAGNRSRPAWSGFRQLEFFGESSRESFFTKKVLSNKHLSIAGGRSGFTLIEILVVLVIMSATLTLAVVNMAPSPERKLRHEALRLAYRLELARDEALYGGRPVGWKLEEGSVLFYQWRAGEGWTPAESDLRSFIPENDAELGGLVIDGLKAEEDAMAVFMPAGFGSLFSVNITMEGRSETIKGDKLGKVERGFYD